MDELSVSVANTGIYFIFFICKGVSFFHGILLWRTLCLEAYPLMYLPSFHFTRIGSWNPSFHTLGVRMLCLRLRNRAFCMQFRVDKLAETFSFGVLGLVIYVGACCVTLCPLSEQISLILVSQSSIRVY